MIFSIFQSNKRDTCIICNEKFDYNSESNELCLSCYRDFVELKVHLRTCKNGTKFFFKRFKDQKEIERLDPCDICK